MNQYGQQMMLKKQVNNRIHFEAGGVSVECPICGQNMTEENTRVAALRDSLEKQVLQSCPDSFVNGDIENRLPNTTNISFEYIEGEAILLMMNKFGICASTPIDPRMANGAA